MKNLLKDRRVQVGGALGTVFCLWGITMLLTQDSAAAAEVALGTEVATDNTVPTGKITHDVPQMDSFFRVSDQWGDSGVTTGLNMRVGSSIETLTELNKLNFGGDVSAQLNDYFTAHGGGIVYTTPGNDGLNPEGWVGVTTSFANDTTVDVTVYRGSYGGNAGAFVEAAGTKTFSLENDDSITLGTLAGQNLTGGDTAYGNVSAAYNHGNFTLKGIVYREGDGTDATLRLIIRR